mmetsp:Transcript_26018/g.62669  ORF Transcript_26018/g.62669 Transcript_26018/m.62669 type:complete len:589 (-) Transcript_26018:264-2030(-)
MGPRRRRRLIHGEGLRLLLALALARALLPAPAPVGVRRRSPRLCKTDVTATLGSAKEYAEAFWGVSSLFPREGEPNDPSSLENVATVNQDEEAFRRYRPGRRRKRRDRRVLQESSNDSDEPADRQGSTINSPIRTRLCTICSGELEGGTRGHLEHPMHKVNVERQRIGLPSLTRSQYSQRVMNRQSLIDAEEKERARSAAVERGESMSIDSDNYLEELEDVAQLKVNQSVGFDTDTEALDVREEGETEQEEKDLFRNLDQEDPKYNSAVDGEGQTVNDRKADSSWNKIRFYIWRDPLTRKKFKSENSYLNYIHSKKYAKVLRFHRMTVAPRPEITEREDPDVLRERRRQFSLNSKVVDPLSWDLEKWNPLQCPFDDHISSTIEAAEDYLKMRYDLEIPYRHRVTNISQLLSYFGVKVSLGHFPLSVAVDGRKPSRFKSKKACQAYIAAKKDYGLKFKDNELEYSRFYDMKGLAHDKYLEPKTFPTLNGRDMRIVYPDGREEVILSKKSKKLQKIEQRQNRYYTYASRKSTGDDEARNTKKWQDMTKRERFSKKIAERETQKRRNIRIKNNIKNNEIFKLPRNCPMYLN